MGRMQAEEMRELLSRNQALRWHLQSNHYPPIHEIFIPIAEEAIERANAGEWEKEIEMPNGKTLTVGEIVEGLHLDSFLDVEEE